MSRKSGNRFSDKDIRAFTPVFTGYAPLKRTESMTPQSGNRFSRCQERRHNGRKLPAAPEEVLEQRGGFEFSYPTIDLRSVMAGRSREEANAALDRAALGIGRAIVEAPDSGKRDCRRTHRAGLECHVKIAVGEPLGCEHAGGLADRQH